MRTAEDGTTSLHPAIRHLDGRVEEVVQEIEVPPADSSGELPHTDVTAEDLARWLVAWCAEHGQVESKFLYPDPAHYVFTFELFDDLAKKLGVEKETIGDWFAEAQERRASDKKGSA